MPKKPTHMQVQAGKNPVVENNMKVELWVINKVYNLGTMENLPKQTMQNCTQYVMTATNMAVQIHNVFY